MKSRSPARAQDRRRRGPPRSPCRCRRGARACRRVDERRAGAGVDVHAAVVHQRQPRGDLGRGRHPAVLVVVELPHLGERAERDVERAVGPVADLPGRLAARAGCPRAPASAACAGGGVQPLDVAAVAPDAEQALEPLELGEDAGERGAGARPRRVVQAVRCSDEPMASRCSSTTRGSTASRPQPADRAARTISPADGGTRISRSGNMLVAHAPPHPRRPHGRAPVGAAAGHCPGRRDAAGDRRAARWC